MPYNRKAYAPFSQSAEAGITQAPVDGFIEVDQYVKPVIQAGTLGQDGKWLIAPQSDDAFFISDTAEAVANGAEVLFPNTANADFIDMTGFNDIIIAMLPTRAGNYGTTAVMGPSSQSFANLSPVNAAATLKGTINDAGAPAISNILVDGAESLTANVWNIFYIGDRVRGQKLLNFKILNSSGGNSDINFAFMRLV
jgi:hypothetical protein